MDSSSLLIRNIKQLVGVSNTALALKKGKELNKLDCLDHAYLLIEHGKIKSFGPDQNAPEFSGEILDAKNGLVLPSFIDCHTHLVFAAWREQEFTDRIHGLSYQEIAAKGGGILNSARKLGLLSEDELYSHAAQRLQVAIQSGTGAIEIKSGYGLDLENELKILRVIKRLKENFQIPIKASFLAAHAYPLAFRENHAGYIDLIIKQMMPQIAAEGLADYCDVFCEQNFFSTSETDQILEAASHYNLKARIHTNQFSHSGGIETAIRHRAISVDHLEVCNSHEIEQLKNSETLPVLLPGAAFFMNLEQGPAREMIEAGLPMVLASDFNPGTCPSSSMPFIFSLACIQMKLSPQEAFNAMTLNAAYSLEIQDQLGSLTPGKVANLIITNPVSSFEFLPYSFGTKWIDRILIKGQPVI
ncbi:MAG: imidazolonepropionase [Saprospiraceae bacterium]|nr:imidazolonepropionase [Saprospiraceae bacterium]MBK7736620.1 imidazolonepropionase [Saprospiraceae bacterium]MBK7912016.1 imidazolonepropionase [Saprospiraceae bacterium]